MPLHPARRSRLPSAFSGAGGWKKRAAGGRGGRPRHFRPAAHSQSPRKATSGQVARAPRRSKRRSAQRGPASKGSKRPTSLCPRRRHHPSAREPRPRHTCPRAMGGDGLRRVRGAAPPPRRRSRRLRSHSAAGAPRRPQVARPALRLPLYPSSFAPRGRPLPRPASCSWLSREEPGPEGRRRAGGPGGALKPPPLLPRGRRGEGGGGARGRGRSSLPPTPAGLKVTSPGGELASGEGRGSRGHVGLREPLGHSQAKAGGRGDSEGSLRRKAALGSPGSPAGTAKPVVATTTNPVDSYRERKAHLA